MVDIDVQQQIEATLHKMVLDPKPLHMKGHQDNKGHTNFTWEAKLNIKANKLVTTAKGNIILDQRRATFEPYLACSAYLYINGMPITLEYASKICTAWYTQKLHAHFKEKFHWKDKQCSDVAWDVTGPHLNSLDFYNR